MNSANAYLNPRYEKEGKEGLTSLKKKKQKMCKGLYIDRVTGIPIQ